jgi:hypothetical protein
MKMIYQWRPVPHIEVERRFIQVFAGAMSSAVNEGAFAARFGSKAEVVKALADFDPRDPAKVAATKRRHDKSLHYNGQTTAVILVGLLRLEGKVDVKGTSLTIRAAILLIPSKTKRDSASTFPSLFYQVHFDNGSYVGIVDKASYNEAVDVGSNLLPYLIDAVGCSQPTTAAQSDIVETLRRSFDSASRCKAAQSGWDRAERRYISKSEVENPSEFFRQCFPMQSCSVWLG